MRKMLLTVTFVVLACAVAMNASAMPKHSSVKTEGHGHGAPYGLSADCTLNLYNWCAGYIWQFNEVAHAVWESVSDPHECPGGCTNGGAVSEIVLYERCNAGPPGHIDDLAITSIDAAKCPTAVLCDLGAMTLTHCVSGDRWTTVSLNSPCHLGGNPFAIQITWGSDTTNPQPSTSNGIANFYCSMGYVSTFPGCASTGRTCNGYSLALDPQRSYIVWTDWDGNGTLDNICAMYGQPASLAFPYISGYGYMTNNMPMSVGLDCSSPTAVENTSWGHVKALYQ